MKDGVLKRASTRSFEKGGPVKVYQLFGQKLDGLLEELNEALAA